MDRRTTLVTAGVTALLAVTATAAVAVNTGLLSRPADDVAGTLELPQSATEVATDASDAGDTGGPEVETVYVDVYDQPGAAPPQEVVVVPADASASPDDASAAYDDQYADDQYDEYDDEGEEDGYEDEGEEDGYEDDDEDEYEDEYEEEEGEDEYEEEEGEEEEHEEYEGREDDD